MNRVFYHVWWLLVNEIVCYLAFDFLLEVTGRKEGRRYLPAWLGVNALMITAALCVRLPGLFLADMVLLALFARRFLKLAWEEFLAPLTILFTFYVFMEGFSAVIMSWISTNMSSPLYGQAVQVLISLLLDGLYFLWLRIVRKRYLSSLHRSVSSYLYILLLPCGIMAWSVRYGLKLDSPFFEEYLSASGAGLRTSAFFLMTAGVLMVFMMIQVFSRIIAMTDQERRGALLKVRLEEQKIYIEEARKRNEQFASFQHDIDNHLLVLSGLIREKHYEKAGEYIDRLRAGSEVLSFPVSTGNEVLDTLLREKGGYARGNGIEVACRVRIPEEFPADDMDLCILFANMMDNAVRGCMESGQEKPFLTICTRSRSRFLVIEEVNSAAPGQSVTMGTGLNNIRDIAEKYEGTMELEKGGGTFRISVLLCSKKTEKPSAK